jgi:hypothetical protein
MAFTLRVSDGSVPCRAEEAGRETAALAEATDDI